MLGEDAGGCLHETAGMETAVWMHSFVNAPIKTTWTQVEHTLVTLAADDARSAGPHSPHHGSRKEVSEKLIAPLPA